ncbi:MAG TPA: glutamate racemase [Ideonella sp.]|nr:glutamate racemase [Ideonella sp.]
MPATLRAARAARNASASSSLIGVFDSGVGGLSVLRALHRQLPQAPLLYVADAGHAPYGDRDPAHVQQRSERVVDHLVDQGARVVVIACNTATAWAVDGVRTRHPGVAFVGVEPGVKPAALASARRSIAVMATPSTLASERYADLVRRHAPDCQVHPVPCNGLAAAIERGEAGLAEVDRLLDLYCAPLASLGIDTVVLGCTHYPFVAERIAARLGPGIRLLDTADAVARRAVDLLAPSAEHADAAATVELQTTGDPDLLARMALSGLGRTLPVQRIQI